MLIIVAAALASDATYAARVDGRLTISAIDEETRRPLPVRMELRDARGRMVRLRPKNAITLDDGLYFDGAVTLELRRGSYAFVIEAGPEFRTRPGDFQIERNADDSKTITLLRRVHMRNEGWWAGDLDVQLPLPSLDLALKARGVDFAPVTTAVNTRGRCTVSKAAARFSRSGLLHPMFGPWATLDHREGGGALFLGGDRSYDICRLAAASPSLSSVRAARQGGSTVVALTPFAWDLPIWLAEGGVDAIQLIHRHALQDGVVNNEGWGRPRNVSHFSGASGNGRYSEQIYHHVLNCGLRIPPAAGSGAGANANPIGANRVYVKCGDQCTRESWIDGLRAGRVSVTNGPLLRTSVEGEPPGHVFHLDEGEVRDFQIGLNLAFYDQHRVDYLDIVQNGRVVHEIRLDELARQHGRLPPVRFDASGWFLVRAVTDKPDAYQYATTGPYYVESGYQSRISRESVQYFLAWLDDGAKEFAENSPKVGVIEAARPFWLDLLKRANAE